MKVAPPNKGPAKLVSGRVVLEKFFSAESRPTSRWLRQRAAAGEIPSVRVGGKVLFDPDRVRDFLAKGGSHGR